MTKLREKVFIVAGSGTNFLIATKVMHIELLSVVGKPLLILLDLLR